MVQYDYIYNYSHSEEETAALREQIIQDYVKPLFEACIYKYPMLQSAVLLVAQYWDDEAHDAVHHKFFVSMLETPDLKAIFESYNRVRPTKRKERKTGKYKNRKIEDDPVNLPGLSGHVEVLLAGQEKFYQDTNYQIGWADNEKAISAFVAFCKEGCHQLMDISDAYSPYAILRRKGKEIEVEVVGKMRRPWLNGIKPEWY